MRNTVLVCDALVYLTAVAAFAAAAARRGRARLALQLQLSLACIAVCMHACAETKVTNVKRYNG